MKFKESSKYFIEGCGPGTQGCEPNEQGLYPGLLEMLWRHCQFKITWAGL